MVATDLAICGVVNGFDSRLEPVSEKMVRPRRVMIEESSWEYRSHRAGQIDSKGFANFAWA